MKSVPWYTVCFAEFIFRLVLINAALCEKREMNKQLSRDSFIHFKTAANYVLLGKNTVDRKIVTSLHCFCN